MKVFPRQKQYLFLENGREIAVGKFERDYLMQTVESKPTIEETEGAISEFVETEDYSANENARKMDAGEFLGLIILELEKCANRQRSLLQYAKKCGFEPSKISKILRLKKQDPDKLAEDRQVLINYARALGLDELAEVL